MKSIHIYHTHIEVFPYTKNENEKIEKSLSIYREISYEYEPIAYHIENNVLYIPRGYSILALEREFKTKAQIMRHHDPYEKIEKFNMIHTPRDTLQENAINFLTTTDEYQNRSRYSQYGLILDTGIGKTFVSLYSVTKLRMKTIVITHQEKIKKQWIHALHEESDIDNSRIMDISEGYMIDAILENKKIADIYFVNHALISAYAKKHGWNKIREFFSKIKVGIKIIDEVHLSMKNSLRIDMFSNTYRNIYLTANFHRSEAKENMLFKKVFSSVTQFDSTSFSNDKRKHIIYIPVLYNSFPTLEHDLFVTGNTFKFSVYNFSKYSLYMDENNSMMTEFIKILHRIYDTEGKILVTVARIEDIELIYNKIQEEFPDGHRYISEIHSKKTAKENEDAKGADIICTTIKSNGTGSDIKGLRFIINMEAFSSTVTSNQLSGRLREYSPTLDTYFFDLIDTGFAPCRSQYNTKLRYLRRKCKEIRIQDLR